MKLSQDEKPRYGSSDYHVDFDDIFERIKSNAEGGVGRERILAWARNEIQKRIPSETRWKLPDGTSPTSEQFHTAVYRQCERYLDYLTRYPPEKVLTNYIAATSTPPEGEDYQTNVKIEQTRLKF